MLAPFVTHSPEWGLVHVVAYPSRRGPPVVLHVCLRARRVEITIAGVFVRAAPFARA